MSLPEWITGVRDDLTRDGRKIEDAPRDVRETMERIFAIVGRTCTFEGLKEEVYRVHNALDQHEYEVLGSCLVLAQGPRDASVTVEIQTYWRDGERYVRNVSRGSLRRISGAPTEVAEEFQRIGTVTLYWE